MLLVYNQVVQGMQPRCQYVRQKDQQVIMISGLGDRHVEFTVSDQRRDKDKIDEVFIMTADETYENWYLDSKNDINYFPTTPPPQRGIFSSNDSTDYSKVSGDVNDVFTFKNEDSGINTNRSYGGDPNDIESVVEPAERHLLKIPAKFEVDKTYNVYALGGNGTKESDVTMTMTKNGDSRIPFFTSPQSRGLEFATGKTSFTVTKDQRINLNPDVIAFALYTIRCMYVIPKAMVVLVALAIGGPILISRVFDLFAGRKTGNNLADAQKEADSAHKSEDRKRNLNKLQRIN